MYTDIDLPTKKALKEAVAAGGKFNVYSPGPFGSSLPNGEYAVEGPHAPKPRRWYARVQVTDGIVTRVVR